MGDLDQTIWDQLSELESGVYAKTEAFVDADGGREFYGVPSEFVPAIRRAILDALIDDAIANVPPLTIDPQGGTLKDYVVGYLDSHKQEPTP